MRLAVVGTHATGKTTLVAALAARWPGHVAVDEAFYDLGASAVDAAVLSSVSLEPQLVRSLDLLRQPDVTHAIFDRSPLDYLAYIRSLEPTWDIAPWLDPVRSVLRTIDLVVFVPIESPDRVPVGSDEQPRLRKRVDRLLRAIVLDDAWGLGLSGLEVTGSVEDRAAQVDAHCVEAGMARS